MSACHVGANLVPVQATPEALAPSRSGPLARRRRCATIVGPQRRSGRCGSRSRRTGAAPREIRWHQPHLEIAAAPAVAPDPLVRRTTRPTWTRSTRPAWRCTPRRSASPPSSAGERDLYRARVTQLVAPGWSFARIEDGRVVFKAEVACASPYAARSRASRSTRTGGRGAGRRRDGRGRRARAARDRAGRLALRQRAQRARPPRLRDGRLRADRHASPPSCSELRAFTGD